MLEMFQKIHVALPKTVGHIKKQQIVLTDMCVKWFMYKHKSKLLSMKSPRLSKDEKNKEDDIQK